MISRLIGSLESIDISESSMTNDILVSKHSTTKQVSDWLGREGFLLAQEKLTGINGKQLFALSKDELKEIVGFGEGVKLYSKLLREKDLLPSEYKTMNENDLERLLRLRREDIDSKTSENPTTTFGGRENENSNFFFKNIFSPSDLKPERYAEKVKRKPVFPIEFTKSKETSNTSHKTSELTQTKEKSRDKLKDSREKSRDGDKETSRDRSKLKSREKPSKQDSKSKESGKKKTKKSKKTTKLSSESENSDNLSDSDSIYSSNDSSVEKKRKSPSKQKKNKKKPSKSSKSSKTIAQMSTSTSTQENQNFINHPFFQSAPTPQSQTMTHPFVRPITFPAYSPSSFLAPPLATAVNTPFIPSPPTYPYYGPNVLQQPWIGYGNSRYL